jgi:hypothetical protein
MPPEVINADFFTNQHRVRGRIFTGDRRLTDVLNDQLRSSLELSEVEVARVIEPEKVIYTYPSAVLMKEAIALVIIPGERSDGTEGRIFKFIEKRPYEVVLTVPPYEISGVLHLRGTGELRTLLMREVGHFVPMTQARAVFTLFPKVKFFGEVAIVNKALLEVVGALETPDTILDGTTGAG